MSFGGLFEKLHIGWQIPHEVVVFANAIVGI
jgi:hypothetical protein